MTKSELIEALEGIKGNLDVVFRFVDDDNEIDSDCQVDYCYEEDGEIHLSDCDPDDEDDGEEAGAGEVIDIPFRKVGT